MFPAAVSLQILFVFLLFGLKTLSVFFPLTALYVCCGILFSPWTAILSACGGLVICLSIGYCLGRFTGDSLFAAMQKKYPKMKRLTDYREDNLLLFSFELRLLVFLPGDVLSWYMGTCKIPFVTYLFGSLLAMLPGLVLQVLLGATIQEGISFKLIFLLALALVVSVLAALLINVKKHRQNKLQP